MKLLCKTQHLLHALTLVSRAIGTQQALPILGNILVKAEGRRCTLSASDLELSIITSFEASIENEGSTTVPAKAILNFAQYTNDDEVLLETVEGTQLRCTSKKSKVVLAGEAAQEYPTITPITKETAISLEAEPLLQALQQVTFATAKSSLRPVLGGVSFQVKDGTLKLVATDSYRLSEYTVPGTGVDSDLACIVPRKVLEELQIALGGDEGKPGKKSKGADEAEEGSEKRKVEVSLGSQQIEFRIGNTTLLSRLIEGKFPDYQQIIPKDTKTDVTFTTGELTTTIKRMHYFAKELNNTVTITIADNEAHLATPQTQLGRDESTLGVETKGESNKIALSSLYLLDYLGHIKDTGVIMSVSDGMHPAILRVPSQPNFLHLIMPLRLQD